MEKKQWVSSKGIFSYGELPDIHDNLPPAVYELQFDAFKGIFVLEKIGEQFRLPEKVYSLEHDLIKRVLTTFGGLNKNFGVLLKGMKGTGKTIAAKIICNESQLPVILVTKPFTDLANFLNSINQDVIIFFDEFEKIYELYGGYNDDEPAEAGQKHNVSSLLMLMDGVFTSAHKRLFILTTNKDYMPDAMLARPSRIRYIRDFADLTREAILEILNDTVKNKTLIPALVDLLKGLEIITVDIVKAIADEANLYNTADPGFFELFNIKKAENKFDLYEEVGEAKILVRTGLELDFTDMQEGYTFRVDSNRLTLGEIQEHDQEHRKVVTEFYDRKNIDGIRVKRNRVFYYETSQAYHHAFMDF